MSRKLYKPRWKYVERHREEELQSNYKCFVDLQYEEDYENNSSRCTGDLYTTMLHTT